MIQDIGWLIMGLTLLIQSIWDIRYKEIPIVVTIISGVIGILLGFWMQRAWLDVLCALFPGIVCLGISRITGEAIGYGDGYMLCAMGMYVTCEAVLAIGVMAIMMGGIFALVCLVLRRKHGKDQLPFVPFLLVAWVLYAGMQKGIMV